MVGRARHPDELAGGLHLYSIPETIRKPTAYSYASFSNLDVIYESPLTLYTLKYSQRAPISEL